MNYKKKEILSILYWVNVPKNVSKFIFKSFECCAIKSAHKIRLRTSCKAPKGVNKMPGANCIVEVSSRDSITKGFADK